MRFLYWTGNHSSLGQRSLEDIIGVQGHQFKALGHEAIWNPKNDQFLNKENGINIIIEGFTPPVIELMARAKGEGARFIILATEEPTEKGFNHGTQKEMIWRQKIFPEAAKHCEGILHLVPGDRVTKWFSQFAPSAPAELGYAPTLMRDRGITPDYEFGFYGSLTPRRRKILKRLANATGLAKAVRLIADFKTQAERDEAMQHAKVIVQVRKFDAMGLVSSSRCNTALTIGRPVVAEPHDLAKPWDEVVRFTDTIEGFIHVANIARMAWRGIYADQIAKFKAKMNPDICLGQALAQIGVVDGQGTFGGAPSVSQETPMAPINGAVTIDTPIPEDAVVTLDADRPPPTYDGYIEKELNG
jgi:hypothetical protein